MIKKKIVAEVYKDVTGKNISEIQTNTLMMKAMILKLKETELAAEDEEIILTKTEEENYRVMAEHYKGMYIDAYVAAVQCDALQHISSQTQNIDTKNIEKAEKAIFICYHNYLLNDRSFTISES